MAVLWPEIEELIPHRGRSVLLEGVRHFVEGEASFDAVIKADHPYARDGRVEALVGLEMMAQAVAALVGLEQRAAQQPPQVGYLVSATQLEFRCRWLSVGSRLVVGARTTWLDQGSGCFDCSVAEGSETLMAGGLTVVRSSGRER